MTRRRKRKLRHPSLPAGHPFNRGRRRKRKPSRRARRRWRGPKLKRRGFGGWWSLPTFGGQRRIMRATGSGKIDTHPYNVQLVPGARRVKGPRRRVWRR